MKSERLDELRAENQKLRKINRVLMDRVERSTDAQGSAFGLFQAAITLEQTVRQRTAALLEANRAKTRFLAAAGHDMMQPLNVARMFLEMLAEREHDAEAMRLVERIRTALDAGEQLLGTLLDISRFDAGAITAKLDDLSVDRLLGGIAEEYAPQAERRGLVFRYVPCDAVVRSDRVLLERLLRNLVSNALRYTKNGGVLLGCRRRSGFVRLQVWDTGCGIPSESLRNIFTEFRRLRSGFESEPGMGLGLAVVDRIARALAIEVHVASRVGRGSVFSVDVPLADV
jgi:signal transduction histidine kinase